MQSIAFCGRCRGMKIGWNRRYLLHCFLCTEWVSKSSKLLIFTVLLAVLVLAYPTPSVFVYSGDGTGQSVVEATFQGPLAPAIDPAVRTIDTFLQRYQVDESNRSRVAGSIINTAKKYNLDPRLIASIMIVESRANPFAISGSDSIGIMQIHLPTWGLKADREGINLFKIEDNIDFGGSILRDYVRQFGLWEAVKRYKGWFPDDPGSERSAQEYVAKVQGIYSSEPTATSTAGLFR